MFAKCCASSEKKYSPYSPVDMLGVGWGADFHKTTLLNKGLFLFCLII